MERTRLSNTSAHFDSCLKKIFSRTFGKLTPVLHVLFDSRPMNRIHADLIQSYDAVRRMFFGMMDRQAQPACPGFSIAPNTSDCKTAWSQCAARARTVKELAQAVWSNIRKVWRWTCGDYIQLKPKHTTVEFLPATGEEVFNLEVEDDHTYVANGIVVHNCDLLATQNLYGLGAGVYPSIAASGWPAHPNTLSFLVVVFKDEVTAEDKAGKETSMQALDRLTPEQRRGALGVNKAEVFDQGKMSKGMIRSKWSAVKKRIA